MNKRKACAAAAAALTMAIPQAASATLLYIYSDGTGQNLAFTNSGFDGGFATNNDYGGSTLACINARCSTTWTASTYSGFNIGTTSFDDIVHFTAAAATKPGTYSGSAKAGKLQVVDLAQNVQYYALSTRAGYQLVFDDDHDDIDQVYAGRYAGADFATSVCQNRNCIGGTNGNAAQFARSGSGFAVSLRDANGTFDGPFLFDAAIKETPGTYYAATNNRLQALLTVFEADPVPSVAAIPEPASWMTMIAGVGAIGAVMRRRRRSVRVAWG